MLCHGVPVLYGGDMWVRWDAMFHPSWRADEGWVRVHQSVAQMRRVGWYWVLALSGIGAHLHGSEGLDGGLCSGVDEWPLGWFCAGIWQVLKWCTMVHSRGHERVCL